MLPAQPVEVQAAGVHPVDAHQGTTVGDVGVEAADGPEVGFATGVTAQCADRDVVVGGAVGGAGVTGGHADLHRVVMRHGKRVGAGNREPHQRVHHPAHGLVAARIGLQVGGGAAVAQRERIAAVVHQRRGAGADRIGRVVGQRREVGDGGGVVDEPWGALRTDVIGIGCDAGGATVILPQHVLRGRLERGHGQQQAGDAGATGAPEAGKRGSSVKRWHVIP